METFEFCVFIGRFSPFQNAHKAILNRALEISKNVIVVIGSCNTARTIKNPWSANERQEMISSTLTTEELSKIKFVHMTDHLYNDNMWMSTLQSKINEVTDFSENVALIGYESDESSSYLKQFPQYKYVSCDSISDEYKFHATHVRDLYFSKDSAYKKLIPEQVVDYLEKYKDTTFFNYIKQEKDYIDNYREQWRGAPFPPIFMTVDNVVIKSGHVLVVNRKHNPGKGLLALPGGFVNQKEKLQDAALRELKEETCIKINIPDLRKCIVESRVFDEPSRSARGRTITNAYLINLGIGPLPQVKAADDADAIQWLPLSDFHSMSNEFFEDHWHIIHYFISKF